MFLFKKYLIAWFNPVKYWTYCLNRALLVLLRMIVAFKSGALNAGFKKQHPK
jgi:hypothetical protein